MTQTFLREGSVLKEFNACLPENMDVFKNRPLHARSFFCWKNWTFDKTWTLGFQKGRFSCAFCWIPLIVKIRITSQYFLLHLSSWWHKTLCAFKAFEEIKSILKAGNFFYPGIFGIFARNLVARSGNNLESFTLLDGRGCPTDPAIFPALKKIPRSNSLYTDFVAFKFTVDSVVRFQVNIQFCLEECAPARCDSGEESYGRKRRSTGAVASPFIMGSSVENEGLQTIDDGVDDEYLYPDTPLQKEIIVDGTLVTPLTQEPSESKCLQPCPWRL